MEIKTNFHTKTFPLQEVNQDELTLNVVKGQSNEIFYSCFFFIKQLILVPKDMPKSDFEFCRIFMELDICI
jgi:hypothetical protein